MDFNGATEMGRKQLNTPRSRVKKYLRLLWLRSRERAKALKDAKYTCKCGKKQSRAKGKEVYVEVHHDPPIKLENLIDMVYEILLNSNQYPLCKQCHKEWHEINSKGLLDVENKKRDSKEVLPV